MVRTAEGVEPRLVDAKKDMLVIPSLCIHQNRGVNNGMALKGQTDMLPLYSLTGQESLHDQMAAMAGVSKEEVLAGIGQGLKEMQERKRSGKKAMTLDELIDEL